MNSQEPHKHYANALIPFKDIMKYLNLPDHVHIDMWFESIEERGVKFRLSWDVEPHSPTSTPFSDGEITHIPPGGVISNIYPTVWITPDTRTIFWPDLGQEHPGD